ncbi:hypothetical protein FACS1894158_03280 [Betaproteobacteria bacterium]|nr:hypothetical protein FACS1894158_03280 [Betaproteobacteria bacterium]
MTFGIDFGTTNTAVSFLNADNEPENVKFDDAQLQHEYIPSLVVFKDKNTPQEETFWGVDAQERVGDPGHSSYRNFKMLLNEPKEVIKKFWGDADKDPGELTGGFLSYLFKQIKKQCNIEPKKVVVTTPNIWMPDLLGQGKREILISFIKKLGAQTIEVKAEPEAAASYWLHEYKKKYKKDFSGHLLVCDCGGGTLDFSLVSIVIRNGMPEVEVLNTKSNGFVGKTLGKAGVAFDNAVVKELFPKLQVESQQRWNEMLEDFERKKILKTRHITNGLKSYRNDPTTMEGSSGLFNVGGKDVEAGTLCMAFDEYIKPGIESMLQKIRAFLQSNEINEHDPETFRVVLAGGFSRFGLVEDTIKRFFGSQTSSDKRFVDIFTPQDRVFAIAKGAALIANSLIKVIETCPYDVGITVHEVKNSPTGTTIVSNDRLILNKGVEIEKYKITQWWPEKFQPIGDVGLPLFIQSDKVSRRVELADINLSSALPADCRRVQVGVSMDDDKSFFFHARDADNTENQKKTSLGTLLKLLPPGLYID